MSTEPRKNGRLAAFFADDGAILRAAFFVMLAGTLSVLYLDYSELSAAESSSARSPLIPVLPFLDPHGPVLPGGPAVTTDPDLLDAAMTVTLAPGGVLELTGTIDLGAAQRFADEVEARGEYIDRVALNSPGGSLHDALEIGDLLREKGFATGVANGAFCASSCPLILAAGTERTAGPAAAVGVHQFSALAPADSMPIGARAAGNAMASAQETTAVITRYLTRMGVDPAIWLHALETPPDRLYYLSAEEMEQYRLVSPAPGATTAAAQ